MQVRDGLSPVCARIGDDTEALLGQPQFSCDLRDDREMDVRDEISILPAEVQETRTVRLRNDEDVVGRLRLQVAKGEDTIVFIHLRRGNLP